MATYADATAVYEEYARKCNDDPQRSLHEFRSLLSGMALAEDEIDDVFWAALFDTAGNGDTSKAWAWNKKIRNATAVGRYVKTRWAVFYRNKKVKK